MSHYGHCDGPWWLARTDRTATPTAIRASCAASTRSESLTDVVLGESALPLSTRLGTPRARRRKFRLRVPRPRRADAGESAPPRAFRHSVEARTRSCLSSRLSGKVVRLGREPCGHGCEFIGVDRDQQFLMPPSVRDWVPEGHLVWTVLDAVGELELSAFYADYRVDGYRGRRMSRR
jgi:hypothetical protein